MIIAYLNVGAIFRYRRPASRHSEEAAGAESDQIKRYNMRLNIRNSIIDLPSGTASLCQPSLVGTFLRRVAGAISLCCSSVKIN